jgi:hypothetical protein
MSSIGGHFFGFSINVEGIAIYNASGINLQQKALVSVTKNVFLTLQ